MGASKSKDKMHCTRYLKGKGPPPLADTVKRKKRGTRKHKKKPQIEQGSQPDGGNLDWTIERRSLPGYPKRDTIRIIFHFEDGIQSDKHPHPGHIYKGSDTVAYLPKSRRGTKVLRLLEKAFQHKLLFTVAVNNNGEYCVMPADIPLKTQDSEGHGSLGYPDPKYMKSVRKCLAAKRIK